jgi:hypothetical protein
MLTGGDMAHNTEIHKLAVVDWFTGINFTMSILLELGGKHSTYYCSHVTIKDFPKEIRILAKNNIDIVVDDYELALFHSCMLSDIWYYWHFNNRNIGHRAFFEIALEKKIKMIYYTHGTDDVPSPPSGSYMLYSSERQFYQGMGKSKYMLDECGKPVWAVNTDGGEGVVAGIIHLGDWAHAKDSKSDLKRQLAQQLGVNFDPDLPLLVYYTCSSNDYKEADIGLSKLSECANVLIKTKSNGPSYAEGKNICIFSDKYWGTWLPRFAADYFLAGCGSGALSTAVMLGLPVIPVYTQFFDTFRLGGADAGDRQQDATAQRLKSFPLGTKGVNSSIVKYITPIRMSDTERIVERLHDAEYWKNYEENIHAIQCSIWGRYYTQDAAARAAAYIKNILQHGTMLPSEIAALNKPFAGRPLLHSHG